MREEHLLRAFRTVDGRWHGEPGGDASVSLYLTMPFYPHRRERFADSPYAGQHLLIAVGESSIPPGWTRFSIPPGVFHATMVVNWLLFGSDEPDNWP